MVRKTPFGEKTSQNKKYMSIQAIDLNPIQYFDKSGILMLYSSLIWPVLHVLQR